MPYFGWHVTTWKPQHDARQKFSGHKNKEILTADYF